MTETYLKLKCLEIAANTRITMTPKEVTDAAGIYHDWITNTTTYEDIDSTSDPSEADK